MPRYIVVVYTLFILCTSTSVASNFSYLFMSPEDKQRRGLELIKVVNDEIVHKADVDGGAVYGITEDIISVIHQIPGSDSAQIITIDIDSGEFQLKERFSGIHVMTYLDGPRQGMIFDTNSDSLSFLGLDLGQPAVKKKIRYRVFRFDLKSAKFIETILLPEGSYTYLCKVAQGIACYGSHSTLITYEFGSRSVRRGPTFDVNFSQDRSAQLRRFADVNTAAHFLSIPEFGLFSWNRGGSVRRLTKQSLTDFVSSFPSQLSTTIHKLIHTVHDQQPVLAVGIGDKHISEVLLLSPENFQQLWTMNVDFPCVDFAFSRNGNELKLIDMLTKSLKIYDVKSKRIKQHIPVIIRSNDHIRIIY